MDTTANEADADGAVLGSSTSGVGLTTMAPSPGGVGLTFTTPPEWAKESVGEMRDDGSTMKDVKGV